MPNSHTRIMNIPCDASTWEPMCQAVFKEGHKQARHDAAEIVAEADSIIDKANARIEELEDALRNIRDYRTDVSADIAQRSMRFYAEITLAESERK